MNSNQVSRGAPESRRTKLRRTIARSGLAVVLALVAAAISGCLSLQWNITTTMTQTCTTARTCTQVTNVHAPGRFPPQFRDTLLAGALGIVSIDWSQCDPGNPDFGPVITALGSEYENTLVVIEITCEFDPMLVELPSDWNVQSAFWNGNKPPYAGLIHFDPVASYTLPSQFGTIVTDPGYSAYVMHLDDAGFAYDSLKITTTFHYNSVSGAVAKFLNAGIVIVPATGAKFVIPRDPVGIDFTKILETDPLHAIGLGDRFHVPTLPRTWGSLKVRYR